MNIILRPWAHFTDFEGRSSRTEYILFHVVTYGAVIALVAIVVAMSRPESDTTRMAPGLLVAVCLMMLLMAAAVVPGWAVAIRRAHDMGQSGWMVLLFFVPLLGFLFHLVLACAPGIQGENEYGWDPRDGEQERPRPGLAPREVATVSRRTL